MALLTDDFISRRESVLGPKSIHKTGEGLRNLLCYVFLSFLPSASHGHLVLVPKYAFQCLEAKVVLLPEQDSDTKLCFSLSKNPLSSFHHTKVEAF